MRWVTIERDVHVIDTTPSKNEPHRHSPEERPYIGLLAFSQILLRARCDSRDFWGWRSNSKTRSLYVFTAPCTWRERHVVCSFYEMPLPDAGAE